MPEGPRRFLGQTDLPLSPRGVEQALALAKRFAPLSVSGVHSSDLERARQTASILARGRDLHVQEHKWLREIDAGAWEMLTFEEARERYPREHAAREHDLAGSPFPGGESLRDVEARVVPGFQRLAADAAAQGTGDVIVVGHRALNVVLLSHLLGSPLEDAFSIPQDYCAVSAIRTGLAEDGGRWFRVDPGLF